MQQARLLADLAGSGISAQITGALVGSGGGGDLSTAADTAPHIFQAPTCSCDTASLHVVSLPVQRLNSHQHQMLCCAVGSLRGQCKTMRSTRWTALPQALQYMRKLCSHPALVLDAGNGAHREALQAVAPGAALPLRGVQHAPKLAALRELLGQCGIGSQAEGGPLTLRQLTSEPAAEATCPTTVHNNLAIAGQGCQGCFPWHDAIHWLPICRQLGGRGC